MERSLNGLLKNWLRNLLKSWLNRWLKTGRKIDCKEAKFAANSSEDSAENCWQFLVEYLVSKIEVNKVTSQTYKFCIYRDFFRHTAEQTWTKSFSGL